MGRKLPVGMTAFDPKRTSVTGAASRPIAGKRGSHKYSACLKAGDIPVGAGLPAMRPVLTTELWISVRLGSIAVSRNPLFVGPKQTLSS